MPENPPDPVGGFLADNASALAALTDRVAAVETRLAQLEAALAALTPAPEEAP